MTLQKMMKEPEMMRNLVIFIQRVKLKTKKKVPKAQVEEHVLAEKLKHGNVHKAEGVATITKRILYPRIVVQVLRVELNGAIGPLYTCIIYNIHPLILSKVRKLG